MIVAVGMVLPRPEGLSDRAALTSIIRVSCTQCWWVCGPTGPLGAPGSYLRRHAGGGKQAGLVGCRRVLDSTPLYDSVATMDTVTLVRSAIRGLLAAAGDLGAGLRGLLARA